MGLVTLADVKEFLNITVSAHDARIQRYLDAAASQIAYITGPIAPQQFTETFDGGGTFIMLRNPPVLAVLSVIEYIGLTPWTLTNQPPGSTTSQYGYSLDEPSSGKLVRRNSAGMAQRFMGGDQSIVVTYTAGMSVVDPAIYLAVLEDIRGLYSQSQFGAQPTPGGHEPDDLWSSPMSTFPRLQAILQGFQRIPGIA
jgi:hypothetical protein